jgi:hypothetical protein
VDLLVAATRKAFVEGTADLALEFADAPLVGGGLDLVDAAFFGGVDGEELDLVGPAEGEDVGEFTRNLPVRQGRALDLRGNSRQFLRFLRSIREGNPRCRLGNLRAEDFRVDVSRRLCCRG